MLSTIGPSKDYTTFAAWVADRGLNASQEDGECYSGSDLGALAIQTAEGMWDNTGSTIYAADGHKHNGTDAGISGVAYTAGDIVLDGPGIVLRDLRIEGPISLIHS